MPTIQKAMVPFLTDNCLNLPFYLSYYQISTNNNINIIKKNNTKFLYNNNNNKIKKNITLKNYFFYIYKAIRNFQFFLLNNVLIAPKLSENCVEKIAQKYLIIFVILGAIIAILNKNFLYTVSWIFLLIIFDKNKNK